MRASVLTAAEVRTVIASLSYRPGWTFEVTDGAWEGLRIRIVAPHVENSYRPGTTIDLGIDDFLPPMADAEQLVTWVLWRLWRIESHECREWFRRDGQLVDDPHRVDVA